MNDVESQSIQRTGGDLESALLSYSQLTHQDLSRNRFAEEREWYEDALFYQRRQWLTWDSSNKRWSLVKQNPDKPRPMPVTNHFARTINAVANQLSSGNGKLTALPLDDSDRNRRAAEYAEKACKAIDKESDFRIMTPLLGKHATLWGMGVTKDYWDSSSSNGTVKVPQMEVQTSRMLGCSDCGQAGEIPATPVVTGGESGIPCPGCGSPNTQTWEDNTPVQTQVKEFSKGRICTEVRPIFETFVERDCQNPNLSKIQQQRYRMPLSIAKRMWPRAKEVKADEKIEVHEIYLEALRSLVNYNYQHDQTSESITITETWTEWGKLPEKLQEVLEEAVESGQMELGDGDEPPQQGDGLNYNPDEQGSSTKDDQQRGTKSPAGAGDSESGVSTDGAIRGDDGSDGEGDEFEAPDGELDPIEQLHNWGIFLIEGGGKILDWGINNLEGKKPFTFFLWEVDPANVYPKGLGVDLVPLQKRLNRLDSLMELGIMSNAAGKWLWPTTQTTKPPTGSPSDTIEYDPVGDGKIAPEFVQPTPFHQSCFLLRQAILKDFEIIGMTNGIQQGTNPEGQTSFRGIAYLGAKAAEQISTQRFLWETGLQLRYEKCLILAKRNWTEERKVKVAGFNGKYAMESLMGNDLEGDYILEIRPDSSRPQSLEEKEQQFQMLVAGGMVDPADPTTREYVIDQVNLDNVNLTDHLQYQKAERDLQSIRRGQMPAINPNIKIPVFLKVFSDFTLTEEFEADPPEAQQAIMAACEMMEQQMAAMAAAQMAAQAATQQPPPGEKLAGAMQGKQQQKKPSGLNGVPGANTTPEQSSEAAVGEGTHLAAQLP